MAPPSSSSSFVCCLLHFGFSSSFILLSVFCVLFLVFFSNALLVIYQKSPLSASVGGFFLGWICTYSFSLPVTDCFLEMKSKKGNGSSGEEDVMLNTVPDDDEYDTNDSFIDDVELRITYHIRKPAAKKESDDGHNPKKIAKLGNKGRKASSLIQSNSTTQSHIVVMPNIHGANMQFQTALANAAQVSIKKKTVDPNVKEDSSGLLNGVRQRPGVPSSKNHSSTGEHSEPQTNSTHRSNGKSLHASKAHSGRQLDNVDDLDQLIQQSEKGGIVAGLTLTSLQAGIPCQLWRAALMPGKVGSNVRPKSTSLEKAIIELEKIVEESRPPYAEVQDPNNPSPTVKRRLPSTIKQKLAKVARLAQCSYGKIPMDVINRLMSIVGHLMQINTLK
ncbi:hypothetical protein OROHE_014804 [Orobanche hederae]